LFAKIGLNECNGDVSPNYEPVSELPTIRSVKEHGVSEATLYGWKSKYGGMEVGEAQRLKSLEDENRRLKQLVADLSLDREALKAIVRKNGWSLPA
jgi:putative transposase